MCLVEVFIQYFIVALIINDEHEYVNRYMYQ